MKLRKTWIGLATAGVLLASLSQTAVAAGDIQITKVNPEGGAKTRIMRIEVAGRSMPVTVDSSPVLTNADIRNDR